MKKKFRRGRKFVPSGTYPETHEHQTAEVFLRLGVNVEFLKPSFSKGVRTADIRMNGVIWEIKSPLGASGRTLDDTIKRALKQSNNIIIDLRRTSLKDDHCIKILRSDKKLIMGIKRLKIVTKNHEVVDILG